MNDAKDFNRDPITGAPGAHPVGTGVGAAAGVATGAAVGAIGGPVGPAVGAVIGGVIGGVAGAIGAQKTGTEVELPAGSVHTASVRTAFTYTGK